MDEGVEKPGKLTIIVSGDERTVLKLAVACDSTL